MPTDGEYRTSVDGLWALGDVNGRGAFTHTAYQDAEIHLSNLGLGPDPHPRSAQGRTIVSSVFLDPPLGRYGMSLREARDSGRRVLEATLPMSRVSRAVLDSETDGLFRVLVDADTDELLGCTCFGVGGDEVVQVFSAVAQVGGTARQLADALPSHPTVGEFLSTLLHAVTPLQDATADCGPDGVRTGR